MFNVSIPELTDEKLLERYERIRPLVRRDGKLYYLRNFSLEELRKFNFMWLSYEDLDWWVYNGELNPLEGKDFPCLHKYSYHSVFQPTIAEVLSQIDIDLVYRASAFEIIDTPNTKQNFFKDVFTSIAFKNGFHISYVRLYEKT